MFKAFRSLRALVAGHTVVGDLDRLEVVSPFLAVIKNEDTHGGHAITALSALDKLLRARLFTIAGPNSGEALGQVVTVVMNCHFSDSDRAAAEVPPTSFLRAQTFVRCAFLFASFASHRSFSGGTLCSRAWLAQTDARRRRSCSSK